MDAPSLVVDDFSGGITENVLGGDPRRYQFFDNLLITVDKMGLSRPAWLALAGNNSQLPTGNQRVTSMFSWINETFLVSQSERSFFYYDPLAVAQVSIPGVAGNPVLSGADKYAQTTYAEFQKQIYVTSDGGVSQNGSLPVKIFKNDSDVWKGVTAGLPRAFVQGAYTDSSLLATCILLANAIRASMLLHFADNSGGVNFVAASLHKNADTVSAALVNAAPAAMTQASLFILVKALNDAYTAHNNDALIGAYNTNPAPTYAAAPVFHYAIQPIVNVPPVKGPLASLSNVTTPTTVTIAAAQLDDLRQKWYFHRLGINTHSKLNTFTDINKYPVTVPSIGRVSIGNTYPVITPDYTDFINYVNNLKSLYLGHIGAFGPHNQPPQRQLEFGTGYVRDTNVYCPDATDLDSMYLLIYWLRAAYFIHYMDASVTNFFAIAYDTQATPFTLIPPLGTTFIFGLNSSAAVNAYIRMWATSPGITPYQPTLGALVNNTATITSQVTASAANAASLTVERVIRVSGSNSNFVGQLSGSWYHYANDSTKAITTTQIQTGTAEQISSGAAAVGSDIDTWLSLAFEMFGALSNHAFNTTIHTPVAQLGPYPGSATLVWTPQDFNVLWSTYSIQACATPFFVPQLTSYSWAFLFAHTYKVGQNGIEYQVRSNPVLSDSFFAPDSFLPNYILPTANVGVYPSVANPATRSTTLSGLPTLVNTSETNYDLANVKLEIYRTTDGGTTYFLEKAVALGTTTLVDSANDDLQVGDFGALSLQNKLYTTGGIVGSDQPPQCKFIHVLNETVYYGAVFDTGQFFPNRVLQALQGAPDYAPATFTVDLDDDLVGLSSAKDNPIAFCKNSIHRLQGGFNSSGQGSLTAQSVNDTLGAVNAKSIVRTEIGIFFAGTDGFYYTDGFQSIKISLEFDKRYQTFIGNEAQRRAIYGAYDKSTRRVWWSLRPDGTDTDNSAFYIFYLDYGVKPSGVFTTASSYPYSRPSSVVFQQGVLYWGHENGYIMTGDPDNKADHKVDPTLPVTSWGKTYIPYNYTSLATNLTTNEKRKWLTKIHVMGENEGNIALQMNAVRDLNYTGNGIKPLAPINYTVNPRWGTATCVWGDPTQIWGIRGRLDLWRRFPQNAIRCDYFQLQMVPSKIAVYTVEIGFPFGANAVVDAVLKTATIQTPAAFTSIIWPLDVVDYSITFQTDNYVNEYLITALDVTNKIITYSDALNTSISMPLGVKWTIRGIKKEQRVKLASYIIKYAFLGDNNERFPGETSNSGPGNAGENNG